MVQLLLNASVDLREIPRFAGRTAPLGMTT